MGLEIGGLIGDQPVGRAMRAIEAVPGEVLDEAEDLLAHFFAVTLGHAPLDELLLLGDHHRLDLLAHGQSQVVGIDHRVAGHLLGHRHHLLLVHHDLIGVRQLVGQGGMKLLDRGPAVLSIGVEVVHVRPHRARPIEGDQCDHVVERVRLQRPDQRAHRGPLELEHADGVPTLQELEGLLVIELDPVDIDPLTGGLLGQFETALDDREVAEAEEVHLEQTQLLDAVHLVLGDDLGPFPLLLDGDDVDQGLGADHHRGGVDRVLTTQPLDPRAASTVSRTASSES